MTLNEEISIEKCKQTIAIMELFKTQIAESLNKVKTAVDDILKKEEPRLYIKGIEEGVNLSIKIAQNFIDFSAMEIIKEGK